MSQVAHIQNSFESTQALHRAFQAALSPRWESSKERSSIDASAQSGAIALRAMDVVNLFYVQGASDIESAARLGCAKQTVSAARTHVAIALGANAAQAAPEDFSTVVNAIGVGARVKDIEAATGMIRPKLRLLLGESLWGMLLDEAKITIAASGAGLKYTDEEVFEHLRAAARASGNEKQPLSANDYEAFRSSKGRDTMPSSQIIDKRFGTFSNACEVAGLPVRRHTRRSRWDAEAVNRSVAEFIITSDTTNAINNFDAWAAGRKDAPKSIRMNARPRKWSQVLEDAFALIRSDAELSQRYLDRVAQLAEQRLAETCESTERCSA